MAEESLSAAEQPRKLVAIMFTDMVGFTALTQQNEPLSLELLEAHQRLLRPIFVKHHGREIKTIGDAFHIEFASALEAVRCAIDIQKTLIEHNASSPPEKKIQIRIGIHLGDVTPRAQDIFGDAVNIASRIEPLAEPGGVCISQQVYDQVQNKLDTPLVSLGKRDLKNVAVPLEVYRVVWPWEKGALAGAATVTGNRRIKRLRLAALVGVPAVLLVAFFLWWFASPYFVNRVPKASPTVATPNEALSIAVLPFDNVSNDPNNEYFSDGMTDELIDALSKLPGLKVIARTSVFTYKGKPQDVRQIGQQLNVRSILEGSAEKEGDTVRLRIKLVNAADGTQLWSQTYDRQMKDVFAVEDEISQAIVSALQVRLTGDQKTLAKAGTANPEAHDLYLRGKYLLDRYQNSADLQKAISYFEQAIHKDPNYALAYAELASAYASASLPTTDPSGQSFPQKVTYPKAVAAIKKALELDDTLPEAHIVLADMRGLWLVPETQSLMDREYKHALDLDPNSAQAHSDYSIHVLYPQRQFEKIIAEDKKALELDPLSVNANEIWVDDLVFQGKNTEALQQAQRVNELSPGGSWTVGQAYLAAGQYQDALGQFQKSGDTQNPAWLGWVGYIYAKMGRTDDVQKIIEELKNRYSSTVGLSWQPTIVGATGSQMLAQQIGFVYAGLGDLNQCFTWLSLGYNDYDLSLFAADLWWLAAFFGPARSDPRFDRLIASLDSDYKAQNLYFSRQYDHAIQQSQETVKIDPGYPGSYWSLTLAYLGKSQYREALASWQKFSDLKHTLEKSVGTSSPDLGLQEMFGYIDARLADRAAALKIIDDLKQQVKSGDETPYYIALIYLGLGETDTALDWLGKGWDNFSGTPFGLRYDPIWDGIRSDPRFVALIQKAGLDWP